MGHVSFMQGVLVVGGETWNLESLGRSRYRWEDNIKTDMKYIGWECLECMYGGKYIGSNSPPLVPSQSQVISFFGFPNQTVYAVLFSPCFSSYLTGSPEQYLTRDHVMSSV